MRITSKGQVTIPAEIREKAGLLPHMDVEFDFDGEAVRIYPAKVVEGRGRGARLVTRLRGSATSTLKLTTDEIMTMTRGEE